MNTYLGAIAPGPGGRRRGRLPRPLGRLLGRSWPRLGGLLMLGRFTFLFDLAHRVPVLGSVAHPGALPPLGLARGRGAGRPSASIAWRRPGRVRLRAAAVVASRSWSACRSPILVYVYAPVWTEPARWTAALPPSTATAGSGGELAGAARGPSRLAAAGRRRRPSPAARATGPRRRGRLAALLPVLVIVDLLAAHRCDVPTVTAATGPSRRRRAPAAEGRPAHSSGVLRRAPTRSAGEPGYASRAGRLPRRPRHARLEPAAGLGPGLRRRRDADDLAARTCRLHRRGRTRARSGSTSRGSRHLVTGRPPSTGLRPGRAGGHGVRSIANPGPCRGPA